MQIINLFERRATVMEMMLFAYALGIASLACAHMPLVSYPAIALLLFAFALLTYGVWWLARPASRRELLFFGGVSAGFAATIAVLVLFGSAISAFSILEIRNSVMATDLHHYRSALLQLAGLYTIVCAATAYALHALFDLETHNTIRLFALQWAALPILFTLMKCYGLFLPLA